MRMSCLLAAGRQNNQGVDFWHAQRYPDPLNTSHGRICCNWLTRPEPCSASRLSLFVGGRSPYVSNVPCIFMCSCSQSVLEPLQVANRLSPLTLIRLKNSQSDRMQWRSQYQYFQPEWIPVVPNKIFFPTAFPAPTSGTPKPTSLFDPLLHTLVCLCR